MSLVFSNSISKSGIIELIDRNVGTNSTSYPLLDKTSDINLTIDEIFGFMFPKGGAWQLDDSNHTDYPIITTDLVSGQRDYSFTVDENNNVILDIYKVMVANSNGVFSEIIPVDQQAIKNNTIDLSSFYNGNDTQGTPTRYDKTANGILLDLIPSYNYTAGLKVFINREASYFTSSDTTKKLGFAHLFHEYLALRPSYMYAYRNSLPQVGALQNEMLRMQQAIIDYYGMREKDVKKGMRANVENTR